MLLVLNQLAVTHVRERTQVSVDKCIVWRFSANARNAHTYMMQICNHNTTNSVAVTCPIMFCDMPCRECEIGTLLAAFCIAPKLRFGRLFFRKTD